MKKQKRVKKKHFPSAGRYVAPTGISVEQAKEDKSLPFALRALIINRSRRRKSCGVKA